MDEILLSKTGDARLAQARVKLAGPPAPRPQNFTALAAAALAAASALSLAAAVIMGPGFEGQPSPAHVAR